MNWVLVIWFGVIFVVGILVGMILRGIGENNKKMDEQDGKLRTWTEG